MKQKKELLILAIMVIVSAKLNTTFGQSSSANNNFLAGNYLGWSTSHDLPFQLNGTQYLTLRSTGDLNLNGSTNGFQINGNYMLWNNGNTADIFVGYGAGNTTTTGHQNIFIGYNVGSSATSTAEYITAVGYEAASTTTLSSQGTYIGALAGQNSYNGHYPTFIGYEAGQNCTGDGNTFVGYESGNASSFTGGSNTFVGANTGATNTTGGSITLLGYGANVGSSGLTDAAAIGSGAVVNTNYTMILGDNNTSVGIGYSGGTITSQTALDVLYNTGSALTGTAYGGHFINSNITSGTNPYIYGAYGAATGTESSNSSWHYGLAAAASGAYNNVALSAVATSGSGAYKSYGGYFNTSGSQNTYGVYSTASGASLDNFGVYSTVSGSSGNYNYGLYSTVSASSGYNCGVYSTVSGSSGSPNYGLYSNISISSGTNYGVYAQAATCAAPYGGYFYANSYNLAAPLC
jgi:hypothetical protein